MSSMVYCRGCGKEIHETAKSCPHCGATNASSGSG
ncbi:zinc-ribbon domain-containing protein, partial [Escherichia coli]|nr:zinc-ribbon domain-containing protein [Escherichia coli]MCV5513724.1 zinc-ribbon domain-containing protein [Escherichia coli]